MENAKEKRDDLKKKIRTAAMLLIGTEGLEQFSVRKLCKMTGMKNISMVSYYFESKEDLIIETLETEYFEKIKEWILVLNENNDPFEKLTASFSKMMEIFWNYPKIMDLLYFGKLTNTYLTASPRLESLMAAQKELAERNRSLVREITGILSEDELTLIFFKIRGALMYPPLAKELVIQSGFRFDDLTLRYQYVRDLLTKLLNKES